MSVRLARSIGASALVCLAGTAALLVFMQAVSGEWSMHTTLDLGGTLFILATVFSVVTCVPLFLLLRGSAVVSARGRAALTGAASAVLTGVVVVGWFFADGFYPRDLGDWLRGLISVFLVPFPIAGAGFGYAWPPPSPR